MSSKIDEEKSITVEFYNDNYKEAYENFLLNNINSLIHHTIEWKELLEEHYNFNSYYLITKDTKDKIKAVLPMFYIENFCGKRLDSIPLSIYGGAMGEEVYVEQLINRVFELNKVLNCKYVIFRQHPNKYYHVFKKKGMKKLLTRWTQIVKIKDPKILWKEIKKSNRNSIRKALKNDIKVQRLNRSEDLSEFHRLELLTRKRFGDPTPSLSFFKLAWKKLHSKGYMEVFITRYRDMPIASCLIYVFNHKAIYAHSNSDEKFLQFRPNNLQLWRVIEWCYENGIKSLDLGATPVENEGLFFFKSTFNTLNIPFAHYYYPADSILVENTFIGKIGKICIQKSPIFILRVICPFLIKKFG